jgi:CheY-like chemotaxis protein
MSPQQTEKIFEPFQSNFEGGTGLGLAIVYQIVQAHEGRVWARSKLGAGRDFRPEAAAAGCRRNCFSSDLKHRERLADKAETPMRLAACCHRRLQSQREEGRVANILVCDDERSICEMLDIALRREGHRVETVQSGQAAKNKIDGALYDVIVTDIKMPNIDGIEVLRHAHRVSRRIRRSF